MSAPKSSTVDIDRLLTDARRFGLGPPSYSVAMLAVAAGMLAVGSLLTLLSFPDSPDSRGWLAATSCAFVGLTSYAIARTAKGRKLIRRLAARDDTRVVDPMLQLAYHYANMRTQRVAEEALCRLLPRMDLRAYYGLSPAARTTLYEELYLQPPAVAGVIVKTFHRCDDTEALDAVERLAARCEANPLYGDLHQTAQACARYLRRTNRRAEEARSLLRPAAETLEETLLRPGPGDPATDPALLLRSAKAGIDN